MIRWAFKSVSVTILAYVESTFQGYAQRDYQFEHILMKNEEFILYGP